MEIPNEFGHTPLLVLLLVKQRSFIEYVVKLNTFISNAPYSK
jgi:hypothetical protein